MKIRLIVNPKAGSGKARASLPRIEKALRREGLHFEIVETGGPGDASRLVARARDDGLACVGLIGGDGTISEAVQAYLDPDGNAISGPDLGLIPAGTGGDFRKTFSLADSIEEAVARIAHQEARSIDLGVARVTTEAGTTALRAFVNILTFGLAGVTDRLVNAGPKWIGGRAAYFLGALRSFATYRNAPVRVIVDGQVALEQPVLNVAIANAQYFGGGMQIAPHADPSDGQLDVVSLGDIRLLHALRLTPRLYDGAHLRDPSVREFRGSRVSAEALRPGDSVFIDADGEAAGKLPLVASLLPGALRFRI